MRRKKGMTLIELIVVLAIIAIIGAVLILNFQNTTDKARLKSDIQSARVLQNALDLYNAEQSKSMTPTDIAGVINELNSKGYIDAGQAVIQTEGAAWVMDTAKGIVVSIAGCGEHVRNEVFNQLSDQEKQYIKVSTS